MRKRMVAACFALLMALTLVLSVPAAAETYDEGQINADGVNLRAKASTSGTSLGKLDKGQKVVMVKKSGDWWQISTSGYESKSRAGYVLASYISKTGNKIQAQSSSPAAASPTPDAAPTAALTPMPTAAPAAQQPQDMQQYMNSIFASTPAPTAAPTDASASNFLSNNILNSAAPSASPNPESATSGSDSTVAALINAGSETPAPESNLRQDDAGSTVTDTATITAKDVAVRDKASSKGKRLAKLAKGTVLPLLSTELVSKDWYKVSYNGQEAYVSKKYVKIGTQVYEKPDITFEWIRPSDALTASYSAEEMAIWNAIPAKIAEAKSRNSDTIGWIRVPNLTGADETNAVNYPILIYSDNDYYLKRDFNKNKKTGGAIYMDYRNRDATLRKHVIVYGHNMQKSKSDFNYLHNYKNKGFFDSARVIRMEAYGTSEWEVFSVHESAAEGKLIRTAFVTNKSWIAFCEELASMSMYKTNVKFTANDEVLTLVTCDNNTRNDKYRVFVHARRVK